jgi:hypothetical protein
LQNKTVELYFGSKDNPFINYVDDPTRPKIPITLVTNEQGMGVPLVNPLNIALLAKECTHVAVRYGAQKVWKELPEKARIIEPKEDKEKKKLIVEPEGDQAGWGLTTFSKTFSTFGKDGKPASKKVVLTTSAPSTLLESSGAIMSDISGRELKKITRAEILVPEEGKREVIFTFFGPVCHVTAKHEDGAQEAFTLRQR